MAETWKGVCMDDGSGRNVVFIGKDGKRTRVIPEGFVPEYFGDGTRRYYFKGQCIRCRSNTPALFISADKGTMGFALNYCEPCVLATTPAISKIKSNGRLIYDQHIDTPKQLFIDLLPLATDPKRNEIHLQRSKEADFAVKTSMKLRRNAERHRYIRAKAADHHVNFGKFISFGFGDVYDEYFGEVDAQDRPHGYGIKFYSDGSIYQGEFVAGQRHTVTSVKGGMWHRPDDSSYEGTWVKDFKHGHGFMRYPDSSTYTGEFAKSYEHGHGVKHYPDRSWFEGKFRFGKRDGQGALHSPNGDVDKRIFRDSNNEVFHEPALPIPVEVVEEDEKTHFFQPETLVQVAVKALAKAMIHRRSVVPSTLIHSKLQECFKSLVAKQFLEDMYPRGSEDFIREMPNQAFKSISTVQLGHVKFKNLDCECFLYLINSNLALTSLELVNNRLDATSLDMLCKKLAMNTWPNLTDLNLSFNKLDATVIQSLIDALGGSTPTMKIRGLNLSGCRITAHGAEMIARFVEESKTLTELNLAFNFIQASGAEYLAEALTKNDTLLVLNLRQNNLGIVGGEILVEALKYNNRLREMCVADNKIGPDNATAIAARLKGTAREIGQSFKVSALEIPTIYLEKTNFMNQHHK